MSTKPEIKHIKLGMEDLAKIGDIVTRLQVTTAIDSSNPGAFVIRNHSFSKEKPGAFTIRNHSFSLKGRSAYTIRNYQFSSE